MFCKITDQRFICARIIGIGNPERKLLIPDIGAEVCLPGSDTEWDKGVSK